jgi:ESS family glutamate:Na+ symporter
MSLMSMKLWALGGLAGPLVVLLALQLALAVLFAVYVCFRVLGRGYDAAVMAAGSSASASARRRPPWPT